MRRLHQANTNTPERYKELYYGPRRPELRAREPVVALLKAVIRGGTVLDLGCGIGQYFPYMGKAEITGMDFCAWAISEAKDNFPDADLYCVDFSKFISSPNAGYSTVFCSEVLEHMENPQLLIDNIYSVLNHGGLVILTTPYRDAIPVEEHLWTFDEDDMRALFKAFVDVSLLRYSGEGDLWEHFLVLARKA